MSKAPEKIFVTVEYIGKTDTVVCGAFGTFPMDESVEFTRTDLSQAAVAAALEAAAQTLNDMLGNTLMTPDQVNAVRGAVLRIRAMITPAQHDALAAHVAAEVAKARAEDAATVLRYRPTGENAKHFVDVLVCDISNEILTGKKDK